MDMRNFHYNNIINILRYFTLLTTNKLTTTKQQINRNKPQSENNFKTPNNVFEEIHIKIIKKKPREYNTCMHMNAPKEKRKKPKSI